MELKNPKKGFLTIALGDGTTERFPSHQWVQVDDAVISKSPMLLAAIKNGQLHRKVLKIEAEVSIPTDEIRMIGDNFVFPVTVIVEEVTKEILKEESSKIEELKIDKIEEIKSSPIEGEPEKTKPQGKKQRIKKVKE